MSKVVDERVVKMQFDNEQFEKDVAVTMGTLDKFKTGLRMKGATAGLNEVSDAIKNVDMSNLQTGIEGVSLKFKAMFTIADQVLRNVTNSAMIAGKRIVSALTIDPVKTGFKEYETQINAVQTILANTERKGSTLQDVNNALAELNEYADRTIYNFTEMTRNIGTFTAAGVDLKTSVAAIKGIANLAAVSGSTSQQASTAMYQLSQALASGTVKLMDWNSVVNAGMGGQVFQDALKETARVHGINIDAMIKKEGSFRETLKDGWITSEILTETLSKFTGDLSEAQLKSMGYTEEQIKQIVKMGKTANDAATKVKTFTQLFDTLKEAAQSGWTKSWELIIGDFGEAKEILTDISELLGGIIGNTADSRNALLMGGLSTGWKQLLNEGIHDAAGFEEMVSKVAKEHNVDIASMVDEEHTFQDVLKQLLKDGKLTGDVLSESVSKFTDKCEKMSAKELEAAGYTAEHIKKLTELNKKVKDGTVSMDEFVKLIVRPSGRELLIESLWNIINGLKSVIAPVSKAFKNIFPAATGEQLYGLIERIRDFTSFLKLNDEQAENLRRTFEGVFAVLDAGIYVFKSLAGGLIDIIEYVLPAGNGILGFTAYIGDLLVKFSDAVKSSKLFTDGIALIGSILKPIADGVVTFGKSVIDVFKAVGDAAAERFNPLTSMGELLKGIFVSLANVLKKVTPWIANAASAIGDVLSTLMNTISSSLSNADFNSLFDILNGGIFAAIGINISKFIKGLTDAAENLSGESIVKGIKNVLGSLKDYLGALQESVKADMLKKIATAIAILAGSLFVLSLIDPEKLGASLAAITTLFIELMGALKIFTKITDGKELKGIGKLTFAMFGLASALFTLSLALKIMSTMSWSEMGVGLISLTVGLGALIGAVWALPKEKELKMATKAIRSLAGSLVILAVAIKLLSTISWQQMAVGLGGMVVALGALIGVVWALPKEKELKMATKAIRSLAGSLVVLAVAIKLISTIPLKELAVSLGAIIVTLGALIGVVWALPKDKELNASTKAIGKLASSLIVLAVAIKILSTIPWKEMVVGLGGMIVALGALIGFVHALKSVGNLSTIVLGLIGMASALVILSVALKSMGGMTWGEIIRGLVTIAGTFVILGVAAYALGPVAPIIKSLAGSIALLGVGVLAAGVGVLVLAAGLTALAAAFTASGGAIVAVVAALIGLIPYIIEQIGVGLIALCNVIAGSGDALCKAITVIVLALVDALVASVPAIVEGALVLIDELLLALVRHIPIIVGALYDFLIAILDKGAEKLPDLIQAGVNLLMAFFSGVVEALKSIDPNVLVNGLVAVGAISALIVAMAAIAALVPLAMVGVLGFGAFVVELGAVLAAVGALAQIPGLKWLVKEGGDFLQAVGTAIGQFIGGIAGGFAKGMTSSLPEVGDNLAKFIENLSPFITGIKDIDESTMTGINSLTDILTAISEWSPNKEALASIGTDMTTLAGGLKTFRDSLGEVDETDMSAVNYAAQAIKALSEAANMIPNDGGLWGDIAGNNDLGDFAKNLIPLATGLVGLCGAVGTFDDTHKATIQNVADAMVVISDASKNIPNDGGLLGFIMGNNDLEDFAEKLPKLGTAVKDLVTNADGITDTQVKRVTDVLIAVTDLANVGIEEAGVNIEKFGESMTEFVNDVSSFCTKLVGVSDINITTAIGKIESILTLADVVNNGDIEAIKSIGEAVKSVGTEAVEKFIGAFESTSTESDVRSALNTFITKAVKIIDARANYDKFADVGKYMVEGFVYGIDSNTFKAEAQARAMAKAALDAANDELGVESPSKEFKMTGKYVVEGFTKGVSDNLRDVKKTASTLGTTMLNATKDVLGIHSPSVVFNKEVGRYIVKGVAEGITSDMSAEEAAKHKAQNIVNAFKEALDIHDLNKAIAEKELNLWSLQYGNKATDDEKNAKTLEYLNTSLSSAMSKQTLAYSEWQEMIKYFGDSSKETKEALGKYLDAQTEVIALQEQVSAMDNQALVKQNRDAEKAMEVRAKRQELWEATADRSLTDAEKDARYIRDLNDDVTNLTSQLEVANKEHSNALKKYTSDSEEVLAAWNKVVDIQIEIAEKEKEAYEIEKAALERERDLLKEKHDILAEEADIKYQTWLLQSGKKVEDTETDAKKTELLNKQLELEAATLDVLYQEYTDLFNDKAFGPKANETKQKLNEWRQQKLEVLKLEKSIAQIEKDGLQRDRDRMQEQYSLASEMADLQYQIWEKTDGRKATASEKNVKKLSVLSQQLKNQSEILRITYQEYEAVAEEYGSRSLEAQSKYKEYMQQQLDIANLQNEINDIQKTAVERQKLAKSDYEEYIKNYAKFYELNGMTREQLEKDARLTAGYDPNDTVANMVNKTNSELAQLTSNSAYDSALSGFREMGSSYVNAVNEGVKSNSQSFTDTTSGMVNTCVTFMEGTQGMWSEIGNLFMEALSNGIKNGSSIVFNVVTAVGDTAVDQLKSTLETLSEAVNSSIDAEPTIRPVLDLSNVEAGSAKLATMISRSHALSIRDSMNDAGSEGQNGNSNGSSGATYNFTQNNYSPKALSSSDIYRQTKNQFATLKKVTR